MGDIGDYWREHREHKRRQPKQDDDYTMGEFYNDLRDARKERRQHQYEVHYAELESLDLTYDVKNGGHHVILNFNGQLADFWPASGKYCLRKERRYGIGLHRLLKHFGVKPRADGGGKG